jgi:hypothetical protein
MSEARRQAQLLRDKFLDNLGNPKATEEVELDNIAAVLYDFAAQLEEEGIKILNSKGAISTGELERSYSTEVTYNSGVYRMTLSLASYWDFVNSGVTGVMNMKGPASGPYKFRSKYPSKKMVLAILKWMRTNVNAIRFEKVKLKGAVNKKRRSLRKAVKKAPDLKTLAYGMATNIKKHGIRKTGFVDTPLKRLRPELNRKLAAALKEDFRLQIRKLNVEFSK